MRVTRLGPIFSAEQGPSWMCSHAAYPTPIELDQKRLRIFIVTRDEEGRGCVGYIDVNAEDPRRVLQISERPCLTPGPLGRFDDRGISIGNVCKINGELWLYYMGWNVMRDVPFRNTIGLAVSKDGRGEAFARPFVGPLIGRSRFDPFSVSYPFVMPPSDGRAGWHMFYGSHRGPGDREDNMEHVLTEAKSEDGIDWRPTGNGMIGLEPGEFGLSRPWYLKTNEREVLFYSIRRKNYTIGVSERDPNTGEWRRVSNDLLGSSEAEWENEASCYAALVQANGRYLMFYNGNGYGRTGIGVAEIDFE